jgi:hypothetical protein
MSGISLIVGIGAVVAFFVACYAIVREGTTPKIRARLCGLQTAAFVVAMIVAIPKQPETDVGKFADAMTRTHGERLAAILGRKQQEKLDALQFTADR